ncbi:hypothetical protein [Mesorhizobium sp.]|uniref:hypothetical protein n=1 Tax=Mesorhizobium sp. TaxID=1871066 RepID=UPI002580C4E7|nr:hypothetical protein [Mesorhizobium sp.]
MNIQIAVDRLPEKLAQYTPLYQQFVSGGTEAFKSMIPKATRLQPPKRPLWSLQDMC